MYKSMKELGLECGGKGPLVLHRDDSYQIMITVPVEIDLPQDSIQFELDYIDVTGMKRSQRYCVRPKFELKGINCMDYGFPNALERHE